MNGKTHPPQAVVVELLAMTVVDSVGDCVLEGGEAVEFELDLGGQVFKSGIT